MRPNTPRLSHLHLVVADVERSVAFYTTGLGCTVLYASAAGTVFVRLGADDTIALEPAAGGRAPGMDHFGLTVADGPSRHAIVHHITGAGGLLVERRALGPGHTTAVVADPDGHLIRL